MSIRIEQNHKDWSKHQFKGLVDGGITVLECKMCDAPLAQVWVTIPDEKIKTEFVAECPHCGNKSFKKAVSGAFHLGHTEYTHMIDYNINGDIVHIKTAKGDKEWKKK